jgi:DNA-binding winged helix-turn-helix (wHTH) protein
LTKEMFLNHLYGGVDEPELKIIDVFVCKLRKKLARATGGNHYIETVWGRGYRLRDPASMSAAKLVVRPEDLGAYHDPAGTRAASETLCLASLPTTSPSCTDARSDQQPLDQRREEWAHVN